jgi:hypothetical protein
MSFMLVVGCSLLVVSAGCFAPGRWGRNFTFTN